jgi:nucleotide-binding universal stress UspA family protein
LIRKGIPFLEIIKVTKEEETNLFVMGTQGRTGFKSMLIRSMAEKVVRHSPPFAFTVMGGYRYEN